MRISDWSSDVCSSDLDPHLAVFVIMGAVNSISSWFDRGGRLKIEDIADVIVGMLTRSIAVDTSIAKLRVEIPAHPEATSAFTPLAQIGRASSRASVCQ